MPEIFVNYRTTDVPGVANHIQDDLKRRFGDEHVFYASRSIKAGEDFTEKLLPAVRRSTVLLAVIGDGWLAADEHGKRAIDNEADWTRREIVTAFDHGVHVIPVLVGRKSDRLDKNVLPAELAQLANCQSRIFDTRDSATCLDQIAADVADLVPGLVDRTVAPEPDAPRETRDHAPTLSGIGSIGSVNIGDGSFVGGSHTMGDIRQRFDRRDSGRDR